MKLKEKKKHKKGGTNKTRISSHIFVLSLQDFRFSFIKDNALQFVGKKVFFF